MRVRVLEVGCVGGWVCCAGGVGVWLEVWGVLRYGRVCGVWGMRCVGCVLVYIVDSVCVVWV